MKQADINKIKQYLKQNVREANGKLYRTTATRKYPVGTELGGFLKHLGKWCVTVCGKRVTRQRLVYLIHTGEWPPFVICKDGNINNTLMSNLQGSSAPTKYIKPVVNPIVKPTATPEGAPSNFSKVEKLMELSVKHNLTAEVTRDILQLLK